MLMDAGEKRRHLLARYREGGGMDKGEAMVTMRIFMKGTNMKGTAHRRAICCVLKKKQRGWVGRDGGGGSAAAVVEPIQAEVTGE